MAVNPEMKEFLKDVWTLAIENSSSGAISKTESDKSEAPSAYLQGHMAQDLLLIFLQRILKSYVCN